MLDARKLNIPAMLVSGAAAVAMNLLAVQMVHAEFRLPPIDTKGEAGIPPCACCQLTIT